MGLGLSIYSIGHIFGILGGVGCLFCKHLGQMVVLSDWAGSMVWGVPVYIRRMPCEQYGAVCVYMKDSTEEALGAILFFRNHLFVKLDLSFWKI